MSSSVLGTVMGISNLFLYSYFGQLASDRYEKVVDCSYKTNWHLFPVKLQKYFILIISNMQKPLYYHGFGVINLDLKTFIRVNSGGESLIIV